MLRGVEKIRLLFQYILGVISKKINGSYTYALITKTDNGLFAVDPEDQGVGRCLRVKGRYGIEEIERIKSFLAPNSRVLIVGAHIGTLATPMSKLSKEVVAIEANPNTYELLKINIMLNGVSNCNAINIVASDKEETINFLLSRSNSGGSKRVPKNKKYLYYYDKPKEISVKAFSLDNYLENAEFDIIIMDIEGSEYFALKGMPKILSKAKVLIVEFLPHHLKNVSGVTVKDFLSAIDPFFDKLTIPSKNIIVDKENFVSMLSEMYEQEEGDDGIIFEKSNKTLQRTGTAACGVGPSR